MSIQVKDVRGKIIFPRNFARLKREVDHLGELAPAYQVIDVYGNGTVKLEKYGIVKGTDVIANSNSCRNSVVANALVWKAKNAVVTNAIEVSEKFEVGKVYRAPYDRIWLCKVFSRTPTSIRVAIKSVRDKSWGVKNDHVTLRINQRKSEEVDAEVALGLGWEFWASEEA